MRLSDARVVSFTKREHSFTVHFLKRFIKSSKSISDEFLNGIYWHSCLIFSGTEK